MTSGIKKLEEIHRELWQKSRQEEPFNELQPEEIKKTIKQHAGLDKRTIEKYWEELQTLDRMEEIPRLGRWKIKEPRKEEVIDNAGEHTRVNIRVDKGLKQAAENLGINFASTLNQALAEQVNDLNNYVSQLTGEQLSEQEAEYVFNLVTQELYKKQPSQEAEAKIDKQRREQYKDVFNVDEVDSDKYNHLENLRLQAWELAEALGVQTPH